MLDDFPAGGAPYAFVRADVLERRVERADAMRLAGDERMHGDCHDAGDCFDQPLGFVAALRMLLDSWMRTESAEGSGPPRATRDN